MTETRAKPVTVTLSQATRVYLAEKAKAGFRSLNKEITMRIEESCAKEMAEQESKNNFKKQEAQHEKRA